MEPCYSDPDKYRVFLQSRERHDRPVQCVFYAMNFWQFSYRTAAFLQRRVISRNILFPYYSLFIKSAMFPGRPFHITVLCVLYSLASAATTPVVDLQYARYSGFNNASPVFQKKFGNLSII
jgi:hypothetical protein